MNPSSRTPQSSKLHNYIVFYNNSEEYHLLKREIFTKDTYYFQSESPHPVILDLGAHIGIATLYFKHHYPDAKIIAVEPNPNSFALLQKNIFENQLTTIETIQCALSDGAEMVPFYKDATPQQWHSTAGFIEGAWTREQRSEKIMVQTMLLAECITEPVTFMKMDIEGAEFQVLKQAGTALSFIQECVIEFHPHRQQSLEALITLLSPYFHLTLLKDGKPVTFSKARGLVHIHGVQR